jgi:hypothetical protein
MPTAPKVLKDLLAPISRTLAALARQPAPGVRGAGDVDPRPGRPNQCLGAHDHQVRARRSIGVMAIYAAALHHYERLDWLLDLMEPQFNREALRIELAGIWPRGRR